MTLRKNSSMNPMRENSPIYIKRVILLTTFASAIFVRFSLGNRLAKWYS